MDSQCTFQVGRQLNTAVVLFFGVTHQQASDNLCSHPKPNVLDSSMIQK